MRKFFRHSTDIPIAVRVSEGSRCATPLRNLSVGGLCCEADTFIPKGTSIDISIPMENPIYNGQGVVCWCNPKAGGCYEIGVSFSNRDEAFRARMVEQICRIERYKQQVQSNEGRHLSTEEAAKEWVEKYAESFAQEYQTAQ